MRIRLAILAACVSMSPALALDTSRLPQTCKDTLAEMQGEKARFGELGKIMAGARKAGDNAGFCAAARETLTIIVTQSGRLDTCVGDLATDQSIPANLVGEMTQLKAYYRSMLDAAKKPENDRMKCGLADL